MLYLNTGCGCNVEGTKNGSLTCEQDTGTCFCENGWFGKKCYLSKFIQNSNFQEKLKNKNDFISLVTTSACALF